MSPESRADGAETRTRMGPGVEFDLIRSLLGPPERLDPSILLGPGDDAAVLDVGRVVVSTDLTVEDVHFRRSWLSFREVGFRAVHAAMSDLAAMAARPVGALISLAVAGDDVAGVTGELGEGIRAALDGLETPLLGGDLTSSPGPIMIGVTALGEAQDPVCRSGASAGDEVWVTGVLGGSAGAVRAWRSGSEPSPGLREAFVRPRARVREARWLAERGALHAMIDLSDGLTGDAGHLAAASGVRIVLHGDGIPTHPGLGGDDALELARSGGEDYELCMVASPGALEPVAEAFEDRFGIQLTLVGHVEDGEGVRFRGEADGGRTATGGFDHFAPEGAPC